MPRVATSKPQTISYPAPGARPHRHDDFAVDPHVVVLFGATGDLAETQADSRPGLSGPVRTGAQHRDRRHLAGGHLHETSSSSWPRRPSTTSARTNSPRNSGPSSPKRSPTSRRAQAPRRWPPPSPRPRKKLGPDVRRLHYLSVPPKAARAVITMLRDAKLVERSRVVMEKPFGTDLASAVELNDFVHETFDENADLPHRPLPRQGGRAEHPGVPVRQRSVRADLEPQLHRPHPDRHPRDARPGRARQLLREHRRLQGHGGHPPVPGDGVRRDGAADRAGAPRHQRGEEQGVPVDAAGQAVRTWSAASTPVTAN